MKMLQIYIKEDNLKEYKLQKAQTFGRIYFFEGQVNGIIDVSNGIQGDTVIRESILTDGNISLKKVNRYAPQIIWGEELKKLDKGTSISIEIEGATYFVCIIKYGKKTAYEIHVEEESKEQYDKILEYILHRCHFDGNELFFTNESEAIIANQGNKVLINFKTGKERIV